MRTRVLIPVALTLGLLVGCGSTSGEPGGPGGAEPIEIEQGDTVSLDGGAQARVTSRDDNSLWYQYRPAGGDWQQAQQVYDSSTRWTHEVEVETAGQTVAINAGFWDERELDDDYLPQETVQVICHQGRCSPEASSEFVTSTVLSDDGTEAWLATAASSFAHWSLDAGVGEVEEVEPPGIQERAPYWVQPEGSLAIVTGEQVETGCRLTLLAAEPGTSEFTEPAATEEVPWTDACDRISAVADDPEEIQVVPWDGDVEAAVEAGSVVTFRRGQAWDDWEVEAPESPLRVVQDTNGTETIGNHEYRFGDGTEVVLASPDREQITVQVRVDGSTEWEPVEELARAPRGTVCTSMVTADEPPAGSPLLVTVTCVDEDHGEPGDPPTEGLLLTSLDGRDWDVREIADPRAPLATEDTLIGYGSDGVFAWDRETQRLQRLELRVDAETDALGVTPERDRLIRFTTGERPGVCEPGWSVARVGDEDWSTTQPLPKSGGLAGRACRIDKTWTILEDGREITRTVYYPGDDDSHELLWSGAVLEDKDGELVARTSEQLE